MRTRIQSQAEKLLTRYWKKTGLDVAAFKKIQAQAQTEMRRLVEDQKADAIKHSSALRDRLRYGVESWRKTIERVRLPNPVLVSNFLPGFVEIKTPFIIWPTHGLEMDDSHVEPGNNWAKITGESTASSGNENLRFIFVWENPNDRFAAVNVASFLALNGSCVMTPGKSISFLVGVGAEARVDHYFTQCRRCWMPDCAYRRAPAPATVRR